MSHPNGKEPSAPVPGAGARSATPPSPASVVQPAAASPAAPPATTAIARPAARAVGAQAIAPVQVAASPFALSEEVDPHLALLLDEASERAAAFRALRRRLAEKNDPRLILVTSAQDGEGKSTCAANLALALSESGRQRTLLVEANARRPKLADIFGFQPGHCLLAQLAMHREQADAPWRTTHLRPVGLHVLAIDPDAPGGDPLRGSDFCAAIARWRQVFDYVVVDGPSILSGCEASIIQDAVDAVVVVVRSGATRNRILRRALEQISAHLIAGLVLMDSRRSG